MGSCSCRSFSLGFGCLSCIILGRPRQQFHDMEFLSQNRGQEGQPDASCGDGCALQQIVTNRRVLNCELRNKIENPERYPSCQDVHQNFEQDLALGLVGPESQQVLTVPWPVHQHYESVYQPEGNTADCAGSQHVALDLFTSQGCAALGVEILDVLFNHGPLGLIDVVEDDGNGNDDEMQQEDEQELEFLLRAGQKLPGELIESALVDVLVKDEKSPSQRNAKQCLVGTVHSQVHARDGDHYTENDQYYGPGSVPPVSQGIGHDRFIQQNNGKAVPTRIPEVFGAEPFPVLNPAVVPDRARLLQSLLEDRDDVGGKQEVGEMHNEQQFPIDDDVVDGGDDTNAYGIAKERKQVLDDSNGHGGLAGLIAMDEVEAVDEEGRADGGVEDDDERDEQGAQDKHDRGADSRNVVCLDIADVQFVLDYLGNAVVHEYSLLSQQSNQHT